MVEHPAGKKSALAPRGQSFDRSRRLTKRYHRERKSAVFKEVRVRSWARIFVQSVNWFNYQLARVLSWGLWALIGVLFWEIVTRYIMGKPTCYAMDVATYIFLSYAFLGGGYALLTEAHVRMDAFYSRWSVRRRAIMNAATFLPMAFWLVILIWKGSIYTRLAIECRQVTLSGAHLPIGAIKAVMVAGAAILLLQALAFFIQDLFIARGKPLQ